MAQNETNRKVISDSSTIDSSIRKEARTVLSENITCRYTSNSKRDQFYDILQLLDELSSLNSGSDFYIGKAVRDRAVRVLCLIGEAEHSDLPMVLPESEECVSLTWERHPWKTFVTIYPDEIESTTYNRVSGIRCTAPLSATDSFIDPNKVFEALAIAPRPNTVDLR